MNNIHLKNIYKSFDDGINSTNVFENISLTIDTGKLTALIGKSGSGKSTFLHLIAGLLEPTKGSIFFNKKNINSMPSLERARNLSFVYQFHALLEDLNVMENICLPIQISKTTITDNDMKYIHNLMELIGISDKQDSYPYQLSGGEKQRVSILRSLSLKPKFVLMDEPTGNLDEHNSEKIQNLCLDINKNLDIGIIVATHDNTFANRMETVLSIVDNNVLA